MRISKWKKRINKWPIQESITKRGKEKAIKNLSPNQKDSSRQIQVISNIELGREQSSLSKKNKNRKSNSCKTYKRSLLKIHKPKSLRSKKSKLIIKVTLRNGFALIDNYQTKEKLN